MDERAVAKFELMRMPQEHADAAFADEAAVLAQVAGQDGNAAFALALWSLARSHRASGIQYQAQCDALRFEAVPDEGNSL